MNTFTSTTYIPSGNFQLLPTILCAILGIIIAIPIGIVYATISNFSPIIVIDIFLIFGIAWLLSFVVSKLITIAKSRNLAVNIVIALLVALSSYYANLVTFVTFNISDPDAYLAIWREGYIRPDYIYDIFVNYIIPEREITITNHGRNGLAISGWMLVIVYFIELCAFFSPIIKSTARNYFCENCQVWYDNLSFISLDNEDLEHKLSTSPEGNYHQALTDVKFYQNYKDLIANYQIDNPDVEAVNVLSYHYSLCPKCHQHSILTIQGGMIKKVKKKFELIPSPDSPLVNMNYIDSATDRFFVNLSGNTY